METIVIYYSQNITKTKTNLKLHINGEERNFNNTVGVIENGYTFCLNLGILVILSL